MFLDFRPARITESQQLRNLVESFTCRVVDRAANGLIVAHAANEDRHCMAAADHESDVRFNFDLVKKWREQMTFEMIDREIRFSESDRESLRDRSANH